MLRDIHKRRPLVLNIVTDPDQPRLLGGFGRVQSLDLVREVFDSVCFHTWDEATCANIIIGCDLAIIPIDLSDPFMTGKPENKLLLFWRMGIPVVTSATPTYERTIRNAGLDGRFVCRNQEEWILAIERMMDDEPLRREVGMCGRRFAEAHYGEDTLLARWDAVFNSLGFSFT